MEYSDNGGMTWHDMAGLGSRFEMERITTYLVRYKETANYLASEPVPIVNSVKKPVTVYFDLKDSRRWEK